MNNFNNVEQIIDQSLLTVSNLLTQILDNELVPQIVKEVFGNQADVIDGQNLIGNVITNNYLSSKIEIRSASQINNALGAFSSTTGKIYLAQEFIEQNKNDVDKITAVILEEIGHYLDWNLNLSDTNGDEGEIFSALVRGISLSDSDLNRIKQENDHANIILDGQTIEIEQARVSRPTDIRIGSLLRGYKWSTNTITYSFFSGDDYYGSQSGVATVSDGIKNNVRHFLENIIEPLINLDFVEVADSNSDYGQIRYLLSNGPNYAYAYTPYSTTDNNQGNPNDRAGDIHFNPNYDHTSTTNGFQGGIGTHGYTSILHETLHALGLKHPGNYNGDNSGIAPYVALAEDNLDNTVMTYNFEGAKPATPMPYDILALQYLYGTNSSSNASDTVYNFTSTSGYFDGVNNRGSDNNDTKLSIWDSDGIDTLDFSRLDFDADGYRFDLNEGGWITTSNAFRSDYYQASGDSMARYYAVTNFGTRISFGVTIENAIGTSSNDTFFGNSLDNSFVGGGGIDWVIYSGNRSQYQISNLNGIFTVLDLINNRHGIDTLSEIEHLQFDNQVVNLIDLINLPTLSIDNITVIENFNQTIETVFTVTLSENTNQQISVDYTTVNGTATAPIDFNNINGTLIFAPNQTSKTIVVLIEPDTLVEDQESFFVNLTNPHNATIIDAQGEGIILDNDDDLILESFIGDTTDNYLQGNSNDNNLIGNAGNDTLIGNAGNDTLDGGVGNDSLVGGSGDDIYLVDNKYD